MKGNISLLALDIILVDSAFDFSFMELLLKTLKYSQFCLKMQKIIEKCQNVSDLARNIKETCNQ